MGTGECAALQQVPGGNTITLATTGVMTYDSATNHWTTATGNAYVISFDGTAAGARAALGD